MTDYFNFPSLYPRPSFRSSLFFWVHQNSRRDAGCIRPASSISTWEQIEPLSTQKNSRCRETDPVCRDLPNAPFIKLQKFIFLALERGNQRFPPKSTVAVSNANTQLEIMDVIFETRKRVFHQDLQTQKRLLTTRDKAELSADQP